MKQDEDENNMEENNIKRNDSYLFIVTCYEQRIVVLIQK
jgi:hypothetical protein